MALFFPSNHKYSTGGHDMGHLSSGHSRSHDSTRDRMTPREARFFHHDLREHFSRKKAETLYEIATLNNMDRDVGNRHGGLDRHEAENIVHYLEHNSQDQFDRHDVETLKGLLADRLGGKL